MAACLQSSPKIFQQPKLDEIHRLLDNQYCSNKDIVLDNISFSVGDVEKILLSQGHSAPGPDEISRVFFERLASVLALPLCIVFHQLLYQCAIPDIWRATNITPLYKGKWNREAPDSDLPISLTNVASKILKRLNCNQIKTFGSQTT